jgi:heme/copper-type cytochrome/quinol oxidase subunit 2
VEESGTNSCSDFYEDSSFNNKSTFEASSTSSTPSPEPLADDYNYDAMRWITIVSVILFIVLVYCLIRCRARKFLEKHPRRQGDNLW